MCISMRSECDNTRLESARSEADSERESGEGGGKRANVGAVMMAEPGKHRDASGHETDRAVT